MAGKYDDKQSIKIHERALKVRSMRIANLTYQQIASKLNISIDTVRRDLERITVDFPEKNVRDLIADQNAKIELMLSPMVLRGASGDTKSTMAAVKLLEHQAKLFGLFDLQSDNGQAEAMAVLGKFMESTINAIKDKSGE